MSTSQPITTNVRRGSESQTMGHTGSQGSYSTTPGGTLYSTTPGGSKIIYDKSFLMNLRNSPLSRTPPQYYLPDNILKGSSNSKNHQKKNEKKPIVRRHSNQNNTSEENSEQFQIEI